MLVVGYFGFPSIAAVSQGYSWNEMDWNSDGSTSLREFILSSDIGKRPIEVEGKKCQEYFAYKDGLSVKTICER